MTLRFLHFSTQNLDKYQAQLFFFFSLRYLETAQKMVWTLESSDTLKVVHHPDFTLVVGLACFLIIQNVFQLFKMFFICMNIWTNPCDSQKKGNLECFISHCLHYSCLEGDISFFHLFSGKSHSQFVYFQWNIRCPKMKLSYSFHNHNDLHLHLLHVMCDLWWTLWLDKFD